MGWVLTLLGLVFIGSSFILARKQYQDYQRVQEEMLATVVNAGVLELQTLKSDLSEQLESQYEQLLADLEAKAEELTQHLPQRTTHSPLQVEAQPPSTDSVTEQEEEVFASEKPVFGVGEWGERERLIREMYKLGMNVEAIAKELNIGKGEVSLVLDLVRHEGTS